ncbi:Predicted branched-chain amino acid permease (azaleucine resistance) [Pseudomonas reinekei]|jgi:predicted branched-subunit amino acid permease|uniref:AzlC family ABC transporter permease n=1 Tax=Pseudomonas reinekei TaxID=395598 RepID=A0A1H0QDU6_PSERE|nr:AzlC family ABC transporter permease [Pseudomonas reinekei]KAB0486217.1 AzlC family ABC transporter permease [Pseudomonas reinekei]OLU03567.1 branched-chain amino acid ABC transporter permease [Pseudomonas reinekei]SDP15563.1 Predicted branched-chain amino acid permease (azaleucine resistance) [Pseudomonas reinekei]
MATPDTLIRSSAASVFIEGARDAITFGVAFIFLYLSIGLLSATQSLSLSQALATTLLIFSTPLQFLLIQSYNDGWILLPIIVALNARFVLLSATLAPYIRNTSTLKTIVSLILITPSIFTGCVTRFKRKADHPFTYMIGLGLPIFGISIICTYIGFIAGAEFTSPVIYAAMTLLLPLQFTALAGKHWPHYSEVSSYWLGFIGAPLLVYLFKDYSLLCTPFIIGGLIVLIENNYKKREGVTP